MYITQTTSEDGYTLNHIKRKTSIARLNLSFKISDSDLQKNSVEISAYRALFLSGTKKLSKKTIFESLNSKGIHITTSFTSGFFNISLVCTKKYISEALLILAEIIKNGNIPQTEFVIKKHNLNESIREIKDNSRYICDSNFSRKVYHSAHPRYIKKLSVQKNEILKLTRNNVLKIRTSVLNEHILATSLGDAQVQKECLKFTSNIATQNNKLVQNNELLDTLRTTNSFETVPSKTNVEVALGNTLSLTASDKDYPALMFGLNVLGKVGGFSGRLMSIVREKEGLTYGIYCKIQNLNAFTSGYWYIYTFFTPKDLKKGLSSTKREIKKIVEKGITVKELNTFKILLKNQFTIAHESTAKTLSIYHNALLSGFSEDDLNSFYSTYEKLTKSDVNKALKKYIFPKKLVTSLAGPVNIKGNGIIT